MKPNLEFRCIQSITEAESADKLYQTTFGASSVPTSIQLSWWQKAPCGMWGVFSEKILIGAMSCWLIDKKTYENIKNGWIRERDILPDNIDFQNGFGFYWSEIVVDNNFRNQHIAQQLINAFWHYHQKFENFSVLALSYSENGTKLLKKNNFQPILPIQLQPDGMGVWEKK